MGIILNEKRKIEQEAVYNENGLLEYTKIPNYSIKEDFLTNDELKLYYALLKTVQKIKGLTGMNLQIFTQVALNQIIKINNERAPELYKYINNKSVDFLLYDLNTKKIFCCIELDGISHNDKDQQKKDKEKNIALEDYIKLIRIKSQNYYDEKELINILIKED